jgi:hypothetical protein
MPSRAYTHDSGAVRRADFHSIAPVRAGNACCRRNIAIIAEYMNFYDKKAGTADGNIALASNRDMVYTTLLWMRTKA